MKPKRNLCRVLATGFMVLFFWCVVLYWMETGCEEFIYRSLPLNIHVKGINELKVEIPDKEHYIPGNLYCSMPGPESCGLEQSAMRVLSEPQEQIFLTLFKNQSYSINFVFDNTSQQILVRQTEIINRQNIRNIIGHIGPKGYSDTQNSSLGTFGNLLSMAPILHHNKNISSLHFFLYDLSAQRFYRIDMNVKQTRDDVRRVFYAVAMDSIKITEGPVQNQPDWQPAQITQDFAGSLTPYWTPPQTSIRKFHPAVADENPGLEASLMPNSPNTYIENTPIPNAPQSYWPEKDLFVLHYNGRIDYVDGNTLSDVRCIGYLPQVGFYPNSKSRHLNDLGGYGVAPFFDPNNIYLGMVVAAASRDRKTVQLDFYNAQGRLCETISLASYRISDCSLKTLMAYPTGTAYLFGRYLLDNLQSPLLRLLDMPAVKWVQPQNRQNTLFVHPNSLIGLMKFEYERLGFWLQLLGLMLPSLIICVWLGVLAHKKAGLLGYDELSRDAWFIAVLAFGIPAYITFKLLLPKERMVTCANCGNLRRVEFETCQSCKRDWQKTRDLTTAPDWCVTDTSK